MDQFTPQTPFEWIGLALVIGVVLRICWALFIDYCDSQPIYDPMVSGPEDLPPRTKEQQAAYDRHVELGRQYNAYVIGSLDCLRRPLPPARNMTGAAQAVKKWHHMPAADTEGGEV